jgi:[ribosomal protein S18]-alanine N-acetyltransferase
VIVEVTLRGYRQEDLEAMWALDVVCFEPVFRFSKRAMRLFAETAGALVAVAESDGELVGFAIVQMEMGRDGSRGYVVTLDVAEAWRRRGLARRLMEELEAKAAAAGADGMELHVYVENDGALRLYEGMGYRRVGIAENFYARGMDAFVYAKGLAGGVRGKE